MNESTMNEILPASERVRSAARFPLASARKRLLPVALGWLLCEGLVRVLIPGPIFYSTWFTPGAHRPDPSLGFIFVPEFVGSMRHADEVWTEPLALDSSGFRRAAVPTARNDRASAERIVMLGGASMAFSFGLADFESLHHQTASQLPVPATIQVVSWPGFTLSQDLAKVQRFLDPKNIDQAVVFAYSEDDYAPQVTLPITVPPAEIPMDHGVVLPDDPAARLIGWPYYRSVVLAGGARWWRSFADIVHLTKDAAANEDPAPKQTDGMSPAAEPAYRLAARRLLETGIPQVLVVALPNQLDKRGPAAFPTAVEDGVTILDLRGMADDLHMDWIAGGHYGPRASQAIAARIAAALSAPLPREEVSRGDTTNRKQSLE